MSQFKFNADVAKINSEDVKDYSVAIISTDWNKHITDVLANQAKDTLIRNGVDEENITLMRVPGCFELTFAAAKVYENYDVVIVIGCVIRGDTPHFDYICDGVTQGISHLNAEGTTPIIFGVLTVDTEEQALDRINGRIGKKGEEFALTALKMAEFSDTY